ncbi:MAG: phosphoribosylglycinamide formyltransferase [bacterium]
MDPLRVGVFASGRGSNLEALLKAIERGRLNATIVLVVSNNAQAGALQVGRRHGILALHLAQENFASQEAFDQSLLNALTEHEVEVIALAGYLKKISAKIIREFKHRILNIHPALLPAFGGKGMYGMKVHQAVLDYGCKVSGVTVHLVDEGYDTGPPVLQRCVPVKDDDTAESLAARVLNVEHEIYAQALQLFAEGRVQVRDRRVFVKPGSGEPGFGP